jgi:hypothetical protein
MRQVQVAVSVTQIDNEVQDRTVMPKVVAATEVVGANVSVHPGEPLRVIAELFLGAMDRGAGDVGDCDVGVASPHERLAEASCTASDVDDGGVARKR